tara:strand:- start:569 stop:1150 length:582 start_codon:yes stop_codon:yes gene_type:complete
MHLLDADVVTALEDPNHVHHDRAQRWFHSQPGRGWATCPLTENAFLRITGAVSYPGGGGEITALRGLLNQMCSFPRHQFWSDDVSLLDAALFPSPPLSKHLTDICLLGLAVKRKASLATFDRRIDPKQVIGGSRAYFVIPLTILFLIPRLPLPGFLALVFSLAVSPQVHAQAPNAGATLQMAKGKELIVSYPA